MYAAGFLKGRKDKLYQECFIFEILFCNISYHTICGAFVHITKEPIPNLLVQAPAPYETGSFVPWLSIKPGNIDRNTNYGLGGEKFDFSQRQSPIIDPDFIKRLSHSL